MDQQYLVPSKSLKTYVSTPNGVFIEVPDWHNFDSGSINEKLNWQTLNAITPVRALQEIWKTRQ